MGFWSCFAVLLCLLCLGSGVRRNCTEDNLRIDGGGHYTLTKRLEVGSMLVYHCPKGFYPYPHLSHTCHPTGRWTPPPRRRQTCRMIECPDPNVLVYGNVLPPQERYYVNNETTFECYSGYTLRGSTTRVCQPNGKWSGTTPICSRDTSGHCADPGIPAGAMRSGGIFGIDDTVEYTCTPGLFLRGSKVRVCQENGQWTGTEPACYYKHTYDDPLEVSEAFGSAMKHSLASLASTEDTLGDGRKIKLTKNGILNIYIAVDISESIDDEQIEEAKSVVKKLIEKIASFSVSPNYEIIFFSSEIFEVCKIVEFFGNGTTDIVGALYGFQNEDRANSLGTDLNLAFKTFLERIAWIKAHVGEQAFMEHHHVLIFFTDGNFNMGGSPLPTVNKIKNHVHMNNLPEREQYLDIYMFGIGAELDDDELQKYVTLKTDEKHYFKLKDLSDLQGAFDDIIDEEDVRDLCGLHIYDLGDNTEMSKQRMYPWMVPIAFTNKNRKCIGSLVTPQFVLTASHCLDFDDEPFHVQVDIKDDKASAINKPIKRIYRHRDYNITARKNEGVAEFYDYDVALLQLEDAVKISKDVRTICIPCTQETSDALKMVGESTCLQQEQLLLKGHLEELSFLTRSRKRKVVRAKLGDNRDECIGHALKAQGITTRNATVAVTKNFLCTGGLSPQRDHMSCKGDSGGAVFKDYEHRTIQIGTVSWGTTNLTDLNRLCTGTGLVESPKDSRDFHINLFRVVPFLKQHLGDPDQDYANLHFLEK